MRRGIDAARKAGDNRAALRRQIAGDRAGQTQAGGGSIAGADHSDSRHLQQGEPAQRQQHRRRVVDLGQQTRILRRVDEQPAAAELQAGRELGFHGLQAGQGETRGTAAPRKIRQPLQRMTGTAEARQQLPVSNRANRLRADQSQARTLLVILQHATNSAGDSRPKSNRLVHERPESEISYTQYHSGANFDSTTQGTCTQIDAGSAAPQGLDNVIPAEAGPGPHPPGSVFSRRSGVPCLRAGGRCWRCV